MKNHHMLRTSSLDASTDFKRQELALRGDIDMDDVAPMLGCDDFDRVTSALARLAFKGTDQGVIDFMCGQGLGDYLVPIANPKSRGPTWPSILVPSSGELRSDEDKEKVLEILRGWRSCVDMFAMMTRSDPSGWIGGIRVPHPAGGNEMVMRWPWRHRPYEQKGRPGQRHLFNLFGVSVDAR